MSNVSKNSRAGRANKIPKDIGGFAKYIGVKARYLQGGYWNPSKKRRRHG